MRDPPPPQLVALLERTGLAAAGQIEAMAGRVARLARGLPGFESVWVDALAQARVLTPFQAAEINAGRGERLRCGPYLLCERIAWPHYAECYRAQRPDSQALVRLVVATQRDATSHGAVGRLEALAAAAENYQCEHIAPVIEAGSDGNRVWAAAPWVEGRSATEWIVHNGRFPPEAVFEIARAMLAGIVRLEQAGTVHGDLSTAGLILTAGGGVVLPLPGVRGILRPEEGYAHADLLPDAYDCLAPERIAQGTPPTTASDLYACGCAWWHLLCGRAPLAGGDSLAKLRAGHAARVADVRRLVHDCPEALAEAVSACTQREPQARPESAARLAATLGPSTRNGRQALKRCLAQCGRTATRWPRPAGKGNRRLLQRVPVPFSRRSWAAAAVSVVTALAVVWSIWGRPAKVPTANIPGVVVQALHTPLADHDAAADPGRASGPSASKPAQGGASGDAYPTGVLALPPGPTDGRSLRLRAGQRIFAFSDKRATVTVPRGGLIVAVDSVHFENIDFAWTDAPADDPADAPPAVIQLCAARAVFRGCSFQATGAVQALSAAVRWRHPDDGDDAAMSLPSGRLQIKDCVFRRVEAGVDCRTLGARGVELTNVLHLGTGPLVRLDHWPRADEPLLLTAAQVTLRGAGSLLECRGRGVDGQPGEVSIQTAGCVLVPRPGVPLVLLAGRDNPERLLAALAWTGQGSLVPPAAVIAAWLRPDGSQEALDEAAVNVAGVVRSEVVFAGETGAGSAASGVVRWQAPLQSNDPPGVEPAALP